MKQPNTIRRSISRGNIMILAGGLVLTVFFTISLLYISICQKTSVYYSEQLAREADVIIEANNIFRSVDVVVFEPGNGTSVDLSTPDFNALYGAALNQNGTVASKIKSAKGTYDEFKAIASEVLQLNGTDKESAQEMCDDELSPALNRLTETLQETSALYKTLSEDSAAVVSEVITNSTIIGLVFLVAMLIYSIKVSNRMANKISKPIVTVASWAETLSMGADHIKKSELGPETDIDLVEIQRMVKAFTAMSDSIKENVDVVRKVADGDMTAYVNIRSSEDSLGKSLYKMVQSNDIMFAQIAQIAKSVTVGTESIAAAAHLLADSCTEQATAVLDLQEEIKLTNEMTKENAQHAAHANELSNSIHNEIVISKGKMQELLDAMKAISDASEKVSGVIANIESIAQQTNLLAINASIEAKTAGEAGKGFAVVASSVKDLADKSAVSATEINSLVDDTIAKAKRGSQISNETYEAFEKIIDSLENVIEVSVKIAESGANQQENMSKIAGTINEISRVVSSNAASSEETAAMTVEISKNADVLKESMNQFNLRHREPGKPYIPPAKANDKDFVRIATENYNKFLNSPEGRKIAQELNTEKI